MIGKVVFVVSDSLLSKLALMIIVMVLLGGPASAQVFGEEPHVLSIVGHTNSVKFNSALGRHVPTCDYKNLDGSIPKQGEACDGSPRLSITTADLQSLRYITQASDHLEFVRRVYERFPRILFITSPNYSIEYKNTPYQRDAEVLNLRNLLPQGVGAQSYDYLASKAREILVSNGTGIHGEANTTMGTIIDPYSHVEPLGGTLDSTDRILPEYSLVFLYNNPDRTTLIHELIHFLINRAQERGVVDRSRYYELGKNDGKLSYLTRLFFDANFDESVYNPKDLAHLDLVFIDYLLENRAMSSPEELEVAYFISKFGEELGVPNYAVLDHQRDFWEYVERYKKDLNSFADVMNGYAPETTVDAINENYSYHIDGKEIPGYFRNYWLKLQVIASSYPKDLLGDELRVNRTNPRTIIDHFVVDVGPRESTTAQR